MLLTCSLDTAAFTHKACPLHCHFTADAAYCVSSNVFLPFRFQNKESIQSITPPLHHCKNRLRCVFAVLRSAVAFEVFVLGRTTFIWDQDAWQTACHLEFCGLNAAMHQENCLVCNSCSSNKAAFKSHHVLILRLQDAKPKFEVSTLLDCQRFKWNTTFPISKSLPTRVKHAAACGL